MRRIILRFTIILIITLGFIWSSNCALSQEKAVLFLKPSTGSFKVGEILSVEVKLDTKGNAINSGRGIIGFNHKKLELLELGREKSIFVFWDPTTSFSNSSGEIIFGGGLPSPGFSGSSGLILKLTFKAKAAGEVTIEFKEGSVLANDPEGTDILGKLEKATFKLEREFLPVPIEGIAPTKLEPPQISTYPTEISSTEVFYLEGSGLAQSTVILYIERENEEPIVKEIDVSPNGSWSYIHERFLQPGEYSVYAKTKTSRGEISRSSEELTILVTRGALQIGKYAIKNETLYGIIILTLIISVLALFFLFVYINHKENENRKILLKEVKEADQSVVQGFSTLKEEVRRELNVLRELKITEDHLPPKTRRERRKILDDLLEDLELLEKVEKVIKKEIQDIENIMPG